MQNPDAQRNTTTAVKGGGVGLNGKEGGPRTSPITGLISNSFIPAFNKLSYNGRLRYGAASINFTAGVALVGNYFYSANGLFDPSVTGGSLQPAGFSQLMLSYDHYVVTKSRCSIIFTNNSSTPAIVSLRIDADTTGTTDPNNLLEMPQENIVFLDPANSYGSTKTLVVDCNIAAFNGIGNSILSDTLFRGDVVSNPTEQSYFVASAFGLKGGSADVFMNVVIDYWATFQEPRELNPSLQKQLLTVVRKDALLKKEEETKRKQDLESLSSLGHFERC
jgi:hypothetical protein